ncbi:hypothetical protein J504_0616 [Acinetobacter baumannii 348935]|nr:hypothetical protein J504_0616 [Acinetobacter baumannii 348935]
MLFLSLDYSKWLFFVITEKNARFFRPVQAFTEYQEDCSILSYGIFV